MLPGRDAGGAADAFVPDPTGAPIRPATNTAAAKAAVPFRQA